MNRSPGHGFSWRLSATALALALAYAPLTWLASESPNVVAQVAGGATLSVLAPPVDVQEASTGFRQPGRSGQSLQLGDRVLAGQGASALVTFFDGSEVNVAPETELRVERLEQQSDGGTLVGIGLALGTTVSRVQQLGTPSSSFAIRTPSAVALVRGTTVETTVQPDLSEIHTSIDGEFDLSAAGVTRRVATAQTVTLPPPPPATRGVAQAPEPTPSGAPPPPPGAPPQPPPAGAGVIQPIAQARASATSYRMRMQSSDFGTAFDMVLEVVIPDRERWRWTSQGQSFEYIRIGQDLYLNFAGQWVRTTLEGAAPSAPFNPDELVAGFDQALLGQAVTRGGIETVEGTQCQVWTVAGPGYEASLCVGLQDNLPRRLVSTSEGFSVTFTFSDWNAPIRIDPPASFQELSSTQPF